MNWGVSQKTIANDLGISRQAVAKHVKRGMPITSTADARAWYNSNIGYRRRRGYAPPVHLNIRWTEDDGDPVDYLSAALADEGKQPEPVKLDHYPEGFWGEDATTSILSILAGGADEPFKSREHVAVAFLCRDAAMRRHIYLLPEMLCDRVGAEDREAAKAALSEWAVAFCERWYGTDFDQLPMLSAGARELSDFYAELPEDISNS